MNKLCTVRGCEARIAAGANTLMCSEHETRAVDAHKRHESARLKQLGRLRARAARPQVLVVDDNMAILNALSIALQQEGCIVCGATTVRSALHSIADLADELALIVTDWELNGAYGDELLRCAEKLEIPAVLISGAPLAARVAKRYGVPFAGKPNVMPTITAALEQIKKEL